MVLDRKYKTKIHKDFKWILYSIIFALFSKPSFIFAITGSASDLSFSVYQEKSNANNYKHFFSTQFSRNLIKNKDHFFDISYKENFLDSLEIKNELKLTQPLEEFFNFAKNIPILQSADGFFMLVYSRPVYTNQQTIKNTCWQSMVCLDNINIGLKWSDFLVKPISSANFYFILPTSKDFVQKSFLFGVGASLATNYQFYTHSVAQFQLITSHSADINFYTYQTSDKNNTKYNIPLITSHQAGLKIKMKKLFNSDILILNNYKFSINFNGTPFYRTSIKVESYWPVSKKFKLIAGLNWGDDILRPQNTALAVHTVFFNPDKTIINLGANYLF